MKSNKNGDLKMKLNKKQKPFCALAMTLCVVALASFVIAPMLAAPSTAHAAGPNSSPISEASTPTGVFSAVQSGTTIVNSIWLYPHSNPINTTINIDIRLDDASNIWGWTISEVAWNASVLQLIGVNEGPFLADNNGSDPTAFVGTSKGLWDNAYGLINGGLSEAIYGSDLSTASSGVVATLAFNVTGYGISPITISGANLRVSPSDTLGVNVNSNSAYVYIVQVVTGGGGGRVPYRD
jgi:hypothetical protein